MPVSLDFKDLERNLTALTHMFGQKIISKDEYVGIARRMGIEITMYASGGHKFKSKDNKNIGECDACPGLTDNRCKGCGKFCHEGECMYNHAKWEIEDWK